MTKCSCKNIHDVTDSFSPVSLTGEIPTCNTGQHTVLGGYQPTSETPFKWCFTGGPMVARFYMLTWLEQVIIAVHDGKRLNTKFSLQSNL